MSISSSPAAGSPALGPSANRAVDAAIAKATARLAADRKAHASPTVLRADQAALAAATKQAKQAADATKPASSTGATPPNGTKLPTLGLLT